MVIKITGPLIRVISDHSSEIKSAALNAICALLYKVPEKLKPMLPQLQPTCIKGLRDSHKVRPTQKRKRKKKRKKEKEEEEEEEKKKKKK